MEIRSVSFKALPQFVRQVSQNVYAGRRPNFSELRALKKEGISQIVDLRASREFLVKFKERFYCFLLNLKYRTIPNRLKNNFYSSKDYNLAEKYVRLNNKGKTYFHCYSGRHRTGLMVEGLEVLSGRKTLQQAMESLKLNDFFVVKHSKKNNQQLLEAKRMLIQKRFKEFEDYFKTQIMDNISIKQILSVD